MNDHRQLVKFDLELKYYKLKDLMEVKHKVPIDFIISNINNYTNMKADVPLELLSDIELLLETKLVILQFRSNYYASKLNVLNMKSFEYKFIEMELQNILFKLNRVSLNYQNIKHKIYSNGNKRIKLSK
jgi:hypothetical protein